MCKAPKLVIARTLCARGNLGQAVAILPIAFPRCGRVLRDSHVASLLGMTILEPLRVRRCRSLHEPIRKKTGPQACARKRVILKIAILRHLSNRIGQQNRRHSASAECCLFLHLRVENHLFFALKSKGNEKGEVVTAFMQFLCETANCCIEDTVRWGVRLFADVQNIPQTRKVDRRVFRCRVCSTRWKLKINFHSRKSYILGR